MNKIDILLTIAIALCAFILGVTVAGYNQFNADPPEHYNIQSRALNYTDKTVTVKQIQNSQSLVKYQIMNRNEQQMYKDISDLTKALTRLVKLLEKLAKQQL